jgi:predicted restriction endonuclease
MNAFRNFQDPIYKAWRKKVYTRDKHQCQWPGCSQKKKLNAHHIKSWSQYPGLRFDINNGITLCKYHHDNIKGMEEIYAGTLLRLLDNKKYE